MPHGNEFLANLALVLGVAALSTILSQRLRLPSIFGYLIAGMIVGPHLWAPFTADEGIVETLAELGVILVMFGIGLEFSLKRLVQVGGPSFAIAIAETGLMFLLGYLVATVLGWTGLERAFTGAIVAISSTAVISRTFEDKGIRGGFTELVFGVLIMEDLVAIVFVAVLTAAAAGQGVSAGEMGIVIVRLATFLAALVGIGLLVVPRVIRYIVRLNRNDITLIAAIGLCFTVSLLSVSLGYSVALGAFISGSLIAESREEHAIARLVRPVRDVFAAIFFVAVGMIIDPAQLAEYWPAVLLLVAIVIVGKAVAVSVSAFFAGHTSRTAVQAGMSLTQIGEFSFIMASIGVASGATRSFLYPVAVSVAAVTVLTTPLLISVSDRVASFVDRKLPRPLQTFAALYGSWIEGVRGRQPGVGAQGVRRSLRLVLIDAALILALLVAVSVELGRPTTLLTTATGIPDTTARWIIAGAGLLVAAPIAFGFYRMIRRLGRDLALKALPAAADGKVDFAAAPRRALVVSLQLGIIAAVIIPMLVVAQFFVSPARLVPVLALLLLGLGVAFWRSANDLYGHAQAGAQIVAAAFSSGRHSGQDDYSKAVAQMHHALPGLGEPVPVRVPHNSPIAGQTLGESNLRGLTGAMVLAIMRDGEPVYAPSGRETILAGDLLAIAGSHAAIKAARALVTTPAGLPLDRS
ncbi:MAG: cation:proton antiporter domain-containing protein [Gemmatimonadota bacterium]